MNLDLLQSRDQASAAFLAGLVFCQKHGFHSVRLLHLLIEIDRAPKPCTPTALGKALAIFPQAVTPLLKVLHRGGFLTTRVSPADQRVKWVLLSRKARTALKKFYEHHHQLNA